MKMLKFGGPKLPDRPGLSTWYETRRDGRRVQVRADPGDTVPVSEVMRWTVDGPENAAEYYVMSGMAEYVTEKKTKKTEAKE